MDMKLEFKHLKTHYDNNDFEIIFNHKLGIYFLKMRSISRTNLLRELAKRLEIEASGIPGKALFEFMFCKNIDNKTIDNFIREIYIEERKERIENEDYLYTQLFKLKVFDWGGFYQNAVEQTIVNNYVKKIQNYKQLCESIDNDISPRLKGYILCSWYNHWTSILIEDMFKDYPDIMPTVGLIKKVDFFWKDFPFDLKVTYFPDGYMELQRSNFGLAPEFTELKQFARKHGIFYDKAGNNNDIFFELLAKISEDSSKEAKEFTSKFHGIREKIIRDTIKKPQELMRWFYQEQGIRRFDAANRFFVVLIDLENLEESWKLKRNKKLLRNKIHEYLDSNKHIDFEKMKIAFNWQDKTYTTYATTLFILKE